MKNKAFKNIRENGTSSTPFIQLDRAVTCKDMESYLEAFMSISNLNKDFAQKCLQECKYDLKEAIELFYKLYKEDKFPETAFLSEEALQQLTESYRPNTLLRRPEAKCDVSSATSIEESTEVLAYDPFSRVASDNDESKPVRRSPPPLSYSKRLRKDEYIAGSKYYRSSRSRSKSIEHLVESRSRKRSRPKSIEGHDESKISKSHYHTMGSQVRLNSVKNKWSRQNSPPVALVKPNSSGSEETKPIKLRVTSLTPVVTSKPISSMQQATSSILIQKSKPIKALSSIPGVNPLRASVPKQVPAPSKSVSASSLATKDNAKHVHIPSATTEKNVENTLEMIAMIPKLEQTPLMTPKQEQTPPKTLKVEQTPPLTPKGKQNPLTTSEAVPSSTLLQIQESKPKPDTKFVQAPLTTTKPTPSVIPALTPKTESLTTLTPKRVQTQPKTSTPVTSNSKLLKQNEVQLNTLKSTAARKQLTTTNPMSATSVSSLLAPKPVGSKSSLTPLTTSTPLSSAIPTAEALKKVVRPVQTAVSPKKVESQRTPPSSVTSNTQLLKPKQESLPVSKPQENSSAPIPTKLSSPKLNTAQKLSTTPNSVPTTSAAPSVTANSALLATKPLETTPKQSPSLIPKVEPLTTLSPDHVHAQTTSPSLVTSNAQLLKLKEESLPSDGRKSNTLLSNPQENSSTTPKPTKSSTLNSNAALQTTPKLTPSTSAEPLEEVLQSLQSPLSITKAEPLETSTPTQVKSITLRSKSTSLSPKSQKSSTTIPKQTQLNTLDTKAWQKQSTTSSPVKAASVGSPTTSKRTPSPKSLNNVVQATSPTRKVAQKPIVLKNSPKARKSSTPESSFFRPNIDHPFFAKVYMLPDSSLAGMQYEMSIIKPVLTVACFVETCISWSVRDPAVWIILIEGYYRKHFLREARITRKRAIDYFKNQRETVADIQMRSMELEVEHGYPDAAFDLIEELTQSEEYMRNERRQYRTFEALMKALNRNDSLCLKKKREKLTGFLTGCPVQISTECNELFVKNGIF